MGCWNETCGITQLPIQYEDPVRMFLLVEQKRTIIDEPVYYHSSDCWVPFGLPLKGTYNDYGGIEHKKDDHSKFLLSKIKKIMIEYPERMGSTLLVKDATIDLVLGRINDGSFKVVEHEYQLAQMNEWLKAERDKMPPEFDKFKDFQNKDWVPESSTWAKAEDEIVKRSGAVYMYHMMVHEDVYQALINYPNTYRWESISLRKKLVTDAKDWYIDAKRRVSEREEMAKELKACENDEAKHLKLMKLDWAMDYADDNWNNAFAGTLTARGEDRAFCYSRMYKELIQEKIKKGVEYDDLKMQVLINEMIDFAMFIYAMRSLRKSFAPQTGNGSQDAPLEFNKFLASTVVSHCEKKIAKNKEEYGDEEEDDIDEGNDNETP